MVGGAAAIMVARTRAREAMVQAKRKLQRKKTGPEEEIVARHTLPNSQIPTELRQAPRESARPSTTMREILPLQFAVFRFYARGEIQILVAVLIFANFIVSATQAEVLPEHGSVGDQVFFGFELFFNIAFTTELLVNMYANFFCAFWKSSWNIFDFVIVLISLLSMVFTNLPGIGVLRLFRAFRVFRLFKRIKSLKVIIEAVLKSLPAVANAFVVLGLIMAIWSIMSVGFFKDLRPEEFGTFFRAMLTFFQIMTLDSWCSGLARPLMCNEPFGYDPGEDGPFCESVNPMTAFFFLSYVLINSVMMANVVVAILLENFIRAMEKLKEDEDEEKAHEEDHALDDVSARVGAEVHDDAAGIPGAVPDVPSTIPEDEVGRISGVAAPAEVAPQDPDLLAKKRLLEFEAKAMRQLRAIVEALQVAEERLESLHSTPGQGEQCLKDSSDLARVIF